MRRSLMRGEAARAEGDEIVFDVHLPSSRLITRVTRSYNVWQRAGYHLMA